MQIEALKAEIAKHASRKAAARAMGIPESTLRGWISGRDSKVITYSKQFGEISRLIISPDMVMANHE